MKKITLFEKLLFSQEQKTKLSNSSKEKHKCIFKLHLIHKLVVFKSLMIFKHLRVYCTQPYTTLCFSNVSSLQLLDLKQIPFGKHFTIRLIIS